MSSFSSSDGAVLSDVHLMKVKEQLIDVTYLDGNQIYLSEFEVTCGKELLNKLHARMNVSEISLHKNGILEDNDGDMVLSRKPVEHESVDPSRGIIKLQIHHSMETQLSDVGLQIWTGALVMIDFMLDKPEYFLNKHILELGSGAGIPSIVAGMIAERVTVTDSGETILRLCEMNYKSNRNFIKCPEESFVIQELDWFADEIRTIHQPLDCIIACDVVYDNDITDAFFRTVHKIMSKTKPVPTLYMSLEKRLNFTVTDLDITCKEYDHFQSCLKQLQKILGFVKVDKFDINNLSNHCVYNRTPQLELWAISEIPYQNMEDQV